MLNIIVKEPVDDFEYTTRAEFIIPGDATLFSHVEAFIRALKIDSFSEEMIVDMFRYCADGLEREGITGKNNDYR